MSKKKKRTHIRAPNPVALALYTTPHAFSPYREPKNKRTQKQNKTFAKHTKNLSRIASRDAGYLFLQAA